MINSEITYISSTSLTSKRAVNDERIIGGGVPTTNTFVTSSDNHKATNNIQTVTLSSSCLPSVTGPVEPVLITHTIDIVMSNEAYISSTKKKVVVYILRKILKGTPGVN